MFYDKRNYISRTDNSDNIDNVDNTDIQEKILGNNNLSKENIKNIQNINENSNISNENHSNSNLLIEKENASLFNEEDLSGDDEPEIVVNKLYKLYKLL